VALSRLKGGFPSTGVLELPIGLNFRVMWCRDADIGCPVFAPTIEQESESQDDQAQKTTKDTADDGSNVK
jgi:hypothetical protein